MLMQPMVAIPCRPAEMTLQRPEDALPRTPVAVYNRATAYPTQHNNHWIHHEFQTPSQHHAWRLHGYDALLCYHGGHPGDPAHARRLQDGWASSAWGAVMRARSAI